MKIKNGCPSVFFGISWRDNNPNEGSTKKSQKNPGKERI